MRTIFVENTQRIAIKEGLLSFFDGDQERALALCDVGALVIANHSTTLSVAACHALDAHDVLCLICDPKHQPSLMMLNLYKYHRLTTRLKKQMLWSVERKQTAAKTLLFYKILHQQKHLEHCAIDGFEEMDSILMRMEEEKSFQQLEAQAARLYFKRLFGPYFIRFEDTFINHALNYTYMCLSAVIAQVVVAKGLHPSLGILHDSSFNNFNLIYDLIEVYRPLADFIVYQSTINHTALTKACKKELLSIFDTYVMFDGRKTSLKRSVEFFVDSFIQHMESGTRMHVPEVCFGG